MSTIGMRADMDDLKEKFEQLQRMVDVALERSAGILKSMNNHSEFRELGSVNIRAEAAQIHHLVHQICFSHSDHYLTQLNALFGHGVDLYVNQSTQILPAFLQGDNPRLHLLATVDTFEKFKMYIKILSFYFKSMVNRSFAVGKNPTLEEVREKIFLDAMREYYKRVFEKMGLAEICRKNLTKVLSEHILDGVAKAQELSEGEGAFSAVAAGAGGAGGSFTSDWEMFRNIIGMFKVFGDVHGKIVFENFQRFLEGLWTDVYERAGAYWLQPNKSLSQFAVSTDELWVRETEQGTAYLSLELSKSLQSCFVHAHISLYQPHFFADGVPGLLKSLADFDEWYTSAENPTILHCLKNDEGRVGSRARDGSSLSPAWILRKIYFFFNLVEKSPHARNPEITGLTPLVNVLKTHIGECIKNNFNLQSTNLQEAEEKKNSKGCLDVRDRHMVALGETHKRYSDLIKFCFQDDVRCLQVLREQMQIAVNQRLGKYKMSVLLSQFLDQKISAKSATESDVEGTSALVILLFGFIIDKDLVLEHMHRQLANRFLTGVSDPQTCSWRFDAEKSIVQRLLQIPGVNDIVRKLSTMCRNVALGTDLMEEWKGTSGMEAIGFNFDVKVFDLMVLPSYGDNGQILLATDLSRALQRFTLFYQRKFEGRKLTWLHAVSTVQIKAKFNSLKQIDMSLFQALVLLNFNEISDGGNPMVLSVEDLVERTGLTKEEVTEIVHVLSGGVKIKQSGGKVFSPCVIIPAADSQNSYRANSEFSTACTKWTMPTKVSTRVVPTTAVLEEDVRQQRKHAIDACVVRVMKQRRTMDFQQMIAEVLAQLSTRFSAEIKVVKQRVDDLIEREFLERDTHNPSILKYCA